MAPTRPATLAQIASQGAAGLRRMRAARQPAPRATPRPPRQDVLLARAGLLADGIGGANPPSAPPPASAPAAGPASAPSADGAYPNQPRRHEADVEAVLLAFGAELLPEKVGRGSPTRPSVEALGALLCAPPPCASTDTRGMAAQLLALGEVREVGSAALVWGERDEARHFIIVLSGLLKLARGGAVIEELVPGSMIGFLFMLGSDAAQPSHRETELRSERPSRYLAISRELLVHFSTECPELERLCLNAMLGRLIPEYRHWIRGIDGTRGVV